MTHVTISMRTSDTEPTMRRRWLKVCFSFLSACKGWRSPILRRKQSISSRRIRIHFDHGLIPRRVLLSYHVIPRPTRFIFKISSVFPRLGLLYIIFHKTRLHYHRMQEYLRTSPILPWQPCSLSHSGTTSFAGQISAKSIMGSWKI